MFFKDVGAFPTKQKEGVCDTPLHIVGGVFFERMRYAPAYCGWSVFWVYAINPYIL